MNSMAPIEAHHTDESLWRRAHRLAPDATSILLAKALTGHVELSKGAFAHAINRSKLRTAKGHAWVPMQVNAALDGLTKAGLLDSKLWCRKEIMHDLAAEAVASAQSAELIAALQAAFPAIPYFPYMGSNNQLPPGQAIAMRLAAYGNDAPGFMAAFANGAQMANVRRTHAALLATFGGETLDIEWLASRDAPIRMALLDASVSATYATGHPSALRPAFAGLQFEDGSVPQVRLRHDLLNLRFDAIRQGLATLSDESGVASAQYEAALALFGGDIPSAVTLYRQALKLRRKQASKRKLLLEGEHGIFFLLTLLAAQDAGLHQEIQNAIEAGAATENAHEAGLVALQALLWLVQGLEPKARALVEALLKRMPADPLSDLCTLLALHALDAEQVPAHARAIERLFQTCRQELPLLARIAAAFWVETGKANEDAVAFLARTDTCVKLRFTEIVRMEAPWSRALASLGVQLFGAATAPAQPAVPKTKRLAWFLDPTTLEVQPVEQVVRKDDFSDGRPVALKRLHERDPRLDYLTEQDRAAVKGLKRTSHGFYSDEDYDFDLRQTLPALIGHPAVFDARARAVRLDLIEGSTELVVSEDGPNFHLALSHAANEPTVFLEPETPNRYRVVNFPQRLLAVQEVLGRTGLRVPRAGRDQLLDLIKRGQPSLPIRAEIEGVGPPAQDGRAAPVVQLLPRDGSLKVTLVVRPFGGDGPAYVAGLGNRSVSAAIAGTPARAVRDLKREAAEREALVAACPSLRDRLAANAHEAMIDDMETQLEFLLELQAFQAGAAERLSIEWPDGRMMKVSVLDTKKIKLRVGQDRDWFAVEGDFSLDDGEVLEMRALLERLERAHGRFVQLDDGRFIAITRQLQSQLGRLVAVSEPHKKGRRVHALGAPALDDLLEDAGEVKLDAAWKKHVARIRAAGKTVPVVPGTLQAELRDYQLDGFTWMARLAGWGAGACLADDMGLGKTVQAIALMLSRAQEGPCLVVAPTSVCANWMNELSRFAPTLRAHRLATAPDRAALVESLGPMDVLVCSYGLLHTEQAALHARRWGMAVLDEAQAIKNAGTRRAQASVELQAGFRLALTGTPVENDLDELWSLFSFVVPGLLGSREGFAKRFAIPIERDRDPDARAALRALVRPFLLRRTKAAVLSELPSRTEQTMLVEMSEGERAFYEALRQRAVEALSAPDAPVNGRKIRILAEIMKLRRACCNPALIDPAANLHSSKLEALLELVEELIANHHRALIFSQFTSHLALVREALDARNVRYEYLDGSTPAAEREKRVAAFQSGSAELFLISLKAGGTGLNLTAADYVVHLDPWWNPAVEDQASDRAHRLGQERPVTIYRLIMQNSIEERIVEMHRDKRDLANDLLDGAEISARLSEDALMELITKT